MGVLEQITKMKKEGVSDNDIVNQLSQQGISPREINDALNQAQIKDAVSRSDPEGTASVMPGGEAPEAQNQEYVPGNYGNTPTQGYAPAAQEENYAPQSQEQQQYYAPEQGYEQQQYAPSGIDTDSVMEISDQIFSEKIKNVQNQLDSTSDAVITLKTKIDNVSDRLKKIETIIDKLQIAILEKIGSYGDNLESIKKEMGMMQDSFSKMITPKKEQEKRKPESYEEKEKLKKK